MADNGTHLIPAADVGLAAQIQSESKLILLLYAITAWLVS